METFQTVVMWFCMVHKGQCRTLETLRIDGRKASKLARRTTAHFVQDNCVCRDEADEGVITETTHLILGLLKTTVTCGKANIGLRDQYK